MSIPALDLNSTVDEVEHWNQLVTTLRDGLTNHGYIYIVNHGISEEIIAETFQKTRDFFYLPTDVKQKYSKSPDVVSYHGYNAKWARESDSDTAVLLREYFHAWPNLQDGDYPKEIDGFKESVMALLRSSPMRTLFRILFRLLSSILMADDIPDAHLLLLEGYHQGILMDQSEARNYSYFSSMFYPKVPDGVKLEASRCSAHTDCSTFTLLFLDEVGGLEKKNGDGSWEGIPTLANGILMVAGDFLEAMSLGKIPALVHRVPTDLKRTAERQSLPVYLLPDNNTVFQPLNSDYSTTFGEYYEKLIRNSTSDSQNLKAERRG